MFQHGGSTMQIVTSMEKRAVPQKVRKLKAGTFIPFSGKYINE